MTSNVSKANLDELVWELGLVLRDFRLAHPETDDWDGAACLVRSFNAELFSRLRQYLTEAGVDLDLHR